MKKVLHFSILIMFCTLVLFGCSSKEETPKEKTVELTISAAASLQDALNNIKANFETEHTNVKIHFNFGASGALQQQISQGAPVDLFFSAAKDKFNLLVEEGLINKENGIDLVGNEIVLVVPKNLHTEIKGFTDLTKVKKISIGTPETVPAGLYAKDALEKLNLWSKVEDNIIFAKDVRQVLTYVEMSNVDAGIVYKTDALTSSKVKLIATADEKSHTPIVYPIGVIKNSPHKREAQLFFEYLQNKQSMETFIKFGFKEL